MFLFHANGNVVVKSKVRPPQLSGEKKGLFSTRTPHRPNPIGLSLCKIDSIEHDTVFLSGVDIIDGTPILDIKPYIPAFDNPNLHALVQPHPLPERKKERDLPTDDTSVATSYFSTPDYVKRTQDKLTIVFSSSAEEDLGYLIDNIHLLKFLNSKDAIKQAIEEILCNEPRSIYRRTSCGDKPYGFVVDNINVTCMIDNNSGCAKITAIKLVKE